MAYAISDSDFEGFTLDDVQKTTVIRFRMNILLIFMNLQWMRKILIMKAIKMWQHG